MSDKASSPVPPFDQLAQRQYVEDRTLADIAPVPERCPACGASPSDDTLTHRHFDCGTAWSKLINRYYSGCKTALVTTPELLAALVNVRAALNCHYDSAVIESEYGALIDAAIAKAKGVK